jgi:hypothetical protein
VDLVRTDVSDGRITSVIRVTIILVFLPGVLRLLVIANVPISPILVTLVMDAVISFEKSVLARATRRHIPEDDILHSHCRENLQP